MCVHPRTLWSLSTITTKRSPVDEGWRTLWAWVLINLGKMHVRARTHTQKDV